MNNEFLTVGDVAKRYGVQDWQVRRSIKRLGMTLERFGRYQIVPCALLPKIAAELQARGWLAKASGSSAVRSAAG